MRGGRTSRFVSYRALALAACAAGAAICAYAAVRKVPAPPPVPAFLSDAVLASASSRLSSRSPTESAVDDACAAIRPLLGVPFGTPCADFLRDHWQQAPRVSRPGTAWAAEIMDLGDVGKMAGSWPMKFHQNHGTFSMHRPASGFLKDERWRRGDPVPTDAVEIAMRERRTLVGHNLEVYWPPVGALIRQVVRFFHTYTQVNLYISPPDLAVATSPHQDAHSVFIVQTHGAKRWTVHAPPSPNTLKQAQRGKGGEVLAADDPVAFGPPLVNVTLLPGDVLFIPRAFFHATATDPAVLAAPDESAAGVVREVSK